MSNRAHFLIGAVCFAAAAGLAAYKSFIQCPTGEALTFNQNVTTPEDRVAELDRVIALAKRKRECLRP